MHRAASTVALPTDRQTLRQAQRHHTAIETDTANLCRHTPCLYPKSFQQHSLYRSQTRVYCLPVAATAAGAGAGVGAGGVVVAAVAAGAAAVAEVLCGTAATGFFATGPRQWSVAQAMAVPRLAVALARRLGVCAVGPRCAGAHALAAAVVTPSQRQASHRRHHRAHHRVAAADAAHRPQIRVRPSVAVARSDGRRAGHRLQHRQLRRASAAGAGRCVCAGAGGVGRAAAAATIYRGVKDERTEIKQ